MRLPSGIETTDYSRTAAQKGWSSGWPSCQSAGVFGLGQIVGPKSVALVQGGVNKRIQLLCQLLISETERRGYMLVKGWCWGYSCRAIAGTNRPSNHSWGLAMDINAPTNPYTSSGQHDLPDWFFAMFRRYGFGVGADYSGRKDWMHVEWQGTPGDADIMTQLAAREFGGQPPPGGDDWTDTMSLAEWAGVVREAFPLR